MAKKPAKSVKKLKVYRTSIGFHDAYVAASSKKAALEAWGSKKDLFARGAAEQVDDPDLERAPIASPGKVIKVSRGSVEEQLAALPVEPASTDQPAEKRSSSPKASPAKRPSKPKRKPKPSRAALDAAEHVITMTTGRQAKVLAGIVKQEAKLANERRRLVEEQRAEMEILGNIRDEKKRAYDAAMKDWRG